MTYAVMLQLASGSWRLHHDPLRWEAGTTTITWTIEDTTNAAARVLADLRLDLNKACPTRGWIIERP